MAMRFDSESEDDATVRGRPMDIARAAAREKFRTEVMEITAEVKQRLNAFRTVARGAEGGAGLGAGPEDGGCAGLAEGLGGGARHCDGGGKIVEIR